MDKGVSRLVEVWLGNCTNKKTIFMQKKSSLYTAA